MNISSEYENLSDIDAKSLHTLDVITRASWCEPSMPSRQHERAAKRDIEHWRAGDAVRPFDAFMRCATQIDWTRVRTVLDVGAANGYYGEILARCARTDYIALDMSSHFANYARTLYPGIAYIVGDALSLPLATSSVPLVLSSACIIQNADWRRAITEVSRVSSDYVIFNRTPIVLQSKTTIFRKRAYDLLCLEIHFNLNELLDAFKAARLDVIYSTDEFWDIRLQTGQKSFVCRKRHV